MQSSYHSCCALMGCTVCAVCGCDLLDVWVVLCSVLHSTVLYCIVL